MATVRVFVYGSLLPGLPGYPVAEPYVLDWSPGKVRGRLYDAGHYPALVLDGNGIKIEGVWLSLREEGLAALDEYEDYFGPGEGNEYERVWVRDASADFAGWIYVYPDPRGLPPINQPSWLKYMQIKEQTSQRRIFVKNKVILLETDSMGAGDRELGATLLETFFSLLKQKEEKPAAIFCVNRGVFALTEQSLASLHLQELEKQGVPVLACKTCVDYYGIGERLTVGTISSMGRFLELAAQHEVFTLS